jgi:flagellar motor switch protein FliG
MFASSIIIVSLISLLLSTVLAYVSQRLKGNTEMDVQNITNIQHNVERVLAAAVEKEVKIQLSDTTTILIRACAESIVHDMQRNTNE